MKKLLTRNNQEDTEIEKVKNFTESFWWVLFWSMFVFSMYMTITATFPN